VAAFRSDGTVAFRASDGKKWFIVVGGERQPSFDDVSAPFFRVDGTLVYGASDGGKHFVVMGQSRSELPHAAKGVVASADGQRITYWYWEGDVKKKKGRMVINGKPGPYFEALSRPAINPETGTYAYTGVNGRKSQVVMPLGASPTYDGAQWLPRIREDGSVAGYVALIKDQLWWKVDRLR
jgi:hypothetical protein